MSDNLRQITYKNNEKDFLLFLLSAQRHCGYSSLQLQTSRCDTGRCVWQCNNHTRWTM